MSEETADKRNTKMTNELDKTLDSVDLHAQHTEVLADGQVKPFAPAQYMTPDREMETHIQAKRALMQGGAGVNLGQAFLSEKEIQWFLDKRKAHERMWFDQWFGTQINFKDPVHLQRAQELYPEFFKSREDVLDKIVELQKRVAKLKLRGPRDLEDYQLMYAIRQFRRQNANRDPGWMNVSIAKFEDMTPNNADEFTRGLFNPRKWSRTVNPAEGAGMWSLEDMIGVHRVPGGSSYATNPTTGWTRIAGAPGWL